MLTPEDVHQRMLGRIDDWGGPEYGTIADHLGLTQGEFEWWVADRSLPEGYAPAWLATPAPEDPDRARPGRPSTAETICMRVVEAHLSGLGKRRIAERFGLAKSTVETILAKERP
jgi:hypothetical protein